jgi:hypothetical protein
LSSCTTGCISRRTELQGVILAVKIQMATKWELLLLYHVECGRLKKDIRIEEKRHEPHINISS